MDSSENKTWIPWLFSSVSSCSAVIILCYNVGHTSMYVRYRYCWHPVLLLLSIFHVCTYTLYCVCVLVKLNAECMKPSLITDSPHNTSHRPTFRSALSGKMHWWKYSGLTKQGQISPNCSQGYPTPHIWGEDMVCRLWVQIFFSVIVIAVLYAYSLCMDHVISRPYA